MKLARVIGNVDSSVKHDVYTGHKIMIVQPLDENQADDGDTFLAVDFVQAGTGDIVLVAVEGNAARQMFEDNSAPVHSVIEAIVDTVDRE